MPGLERPGAGHPEDLDCRVKPGNDRRIKGQCAMITGSSAAPRMWLVAPPKIIWRSRLWV